jgi:hypothetical protein
MRMPERIPMMDEVEEEDEADYDYEEARPPLAEAESLSQPAVVVPRGGAGEPEVEGGVQERRLAPAGRRGIRQLFRQLPFCSDVAVML